MRNNPTLSPVLKERILGGLWGSLVGDALGVPVEFSSRSMLKDDPVISMRAFGKYDQPAGTWSDDGAMSLCTVESLLNFEFNLDDLANRFVRWNDEGLWTANGDVFDIGGTTLSALLRIQKGVPVAQAGGQLEDDNGNGSLMRILPVALRFANASVEIFLQRIEDASAITHGHVRARMACVLFGLTVRRLLAGQSPGNAIAAARVEFREIYGEAPELARFRCLLQDDFVQVPEGMVLSTGYVLHTLYASLWCLLTTRNFRDCVLRAVNLGGDTDTTGCVAGGLAGVAYGLQEVPADWIETLARKDEVESLFNKFAALCTEV